MAKPSQLTRADEVDALVDELVVLGPACSTRRQVCKERWCLLLRAEVEPHQRGNRQPVGPPVIEEQTALCRVCVVGVSVAGKVEDLAVRQVQYNVVLASAGLDGGQCHLLAQPVQHFYLSGCEGK